MAYGSARGIIVRFSYELYRPAVMITTVTETHDPPRIQGLLGLGPMSEAEFLIEPSCRSITIIYHKPTREMAGCLKDGV